LGRKANSQAVMKQIAPRGNGRLSRTSKLKGLARQGYSAEKIARVLRRPVGTTIAVASKLGYRLISNELTDARDDMRLSD
jgi:hypothetical protein